MTRRRTDNKKKQEKVLEEFIRRRSEAIVGIHVLLDPDMDETEKIKLLEAQTPDFLAYLFPEAVINQRK